MTDGTQPTASDPDLPTDPDTAEPATEAPDPDAPTDPSTPGIAEPDATIPSVSPTAAYGGPVSSELDGPPELDRAAAEADEEPTNVERD
ncbi:MULTISPECIES: hypothetical protein [unclassified Agrococcus]|uniref:hypothetical protein n=1 Tax=unclassified Agrococcus TaxID=2615065 RepID=UPI003613577E